MKKAVALLALVTLVPTGEASAWTLSPAEICAIGAKVKLPTRGWKEIGGVHGCSSPYREIGTGKPLANNLAFYATGQATLVQEVKLVLNINNRSQSKSALRELRMAAGDVLPVLTGLPMSTTVQQALESERAIEEKVGSTRIRVVRENWPTGGGYEVQVIIRKS